MATETMTLASSLDELWESTLPAVRTFDPGRLAGLPEPARRYLCHAIAPGTALASAVRLRMHGEIKLRDWFPFTAEQVIRWNGSRVGMIWSATARVHGLPIRGFDRVVDGEGEMRWKLLGIVPVMTASGLDITRSAAGRLEGESVWLPSVLCRDDVVWTAPGSPGAADSSHAHAGLTVMGERGNLTFGIDATGRLESLQLERWGNPEGNGFHYAGFGGVAEEEGIFGGYTIPTRLRIGWHYGTERFEREGELIRVRVDGAEFR